MDSMEKFRRAAALMSAMVPAGAAARFEVTTQRGKLTLAIDADGVLTHSLSAAPFAATPGEHVVPDGMTPTDIAPGMIGLSNPGAGNDGDCGPSGDSVIATMMHGVGVVREWQQ
jgi:hypothetical protein